MNHYQDESRPARAVGEVSQVLPPIASDHGETGAVPLRLERHQLLAITAP